MNYLIKISGIFFISLFSFSLSTAQTIPYGDSMDSVFVYGNDSIKYDIYYHKPLTYDLGTSPLWFAIHGLGGNGAEERNVVMDIANKRNALLITPTMHDYWMYARETYNLSDYGPYCNKFIWLSTAFKEIYQHIRNRENRDSIPVYLSGFSAGGQFVTRYMLIRQAVVDSIPIVMAISISPFCYTFYTDSLNGIATPWPCGICNDPYEVSWSICNDTIVYDTVFFPIICDEYAKMYYNENYGVLIGTADTAYGSWCNDLQGLNRYERAQNFYAFSTSDAIERGTTLNWQYAEIPGVGHDGWAMYHTKEDTFSTSSIAEEMLFETPYHNVPHFPPSADFIFEVSEDYCNQVSFRALCTYCEYPTFVFWNFGDGNTSTDITPTHTYQDTGTYNVELNIWNEIGNNSSADIVTITKPAPTADFTADTTIAYLPDPVIQFQNNSIGAEYYYWDFGDSATSTDINPVHTYLYADTFTVQLVAVGENGCANKIVKHDYITVSSPDQIYDLNIKQPYFTVFPNPLNNKTTIMFQLSENNHVKLKVYNYMGEYVATLFDKTANAGQVYKIEFDTKKLSAGTYFITLKTDNRQITKKMVIIK